MVAKLRSGAIRRQLADGLPIRRLTPAELAFRCPEVIDHFERPIYHHLVERLRAQILLRLLKYHLRHTAY